MELYTSIWILSTCTYPFPVRLAMAALAIKIAKKLSVTELSTRTTRKGCSPCLNIRLSCKTM